MPLAVLAVLIRAAVTAMTTLVRKSREAKPQPLCTGCSFAHIQYTANGRSAISCTFGGDVRQVAIDVLYCTDYRDRNAPLRLMSIGFVPPVLEREAIGGGAEAVAAT